MDLISSSVSILALLFCMCFSLFFLFHKRSSANGPKFPLGKTGWPFLGEALEFVSSGRNGTPDKFVTERMQKFSPDVFKTSLAGENVAVFCGAAGNKFLFSNENKLVRTWWLPTIEKIIISKNSHTSLDMLVLKIRKNILAEFVRPEALQKYVPIIDCMAMQHLERNWSSAANKQVKAFPLAQKFTFEMACRLFMSVEDPNQVASFARHFALVSAGLLGVPINLPGTTFNRSIKAANHIRKELSPILKERRKQLNGKEEVGRTRDLLSQILLATDENGEFLPEVEVVDMVLSILLASHDNVSTVIAFVVYYLADHPLVYDKVFTGIYIK
ncbi:hypothetical protein RJ639_015940 [Escallonia herrerae]|uniref:Cytochrome P450 n=1 Tax=Escallonia herrerae TaxID=1293975 RepID=A0AA88VDM5_9ASTE|nr:hypothetical protein RJ639_015940 [Escallonia herrerae]